MVKHVERCKLKNSIDQNHNAYVRSFSGAKVKCMKDYVKPCIREKNPDYVIFHIGTNELNSELPPKRIAKSTIDVAKNTQSDSRIVSISSIVPRNDNFNIKATEVNRELSKMCDKEKLFFWVIATSTRKSIWIKASFTSTVMVMKNLVRTL